MAPVEPRAFRRDDPARVPPTPGPDAARILTPDALRFVAGLHRTFEDRRRELLRARGEFRALIADRQQPGFLPETDSVRRADWTVRPPPEDLTDRRVEFTGPTDRKMVINALNSGARVYMADFEDAHSPTWESTVVGQANLVDAVRRRIEFEGPDGRAYRLHDPIATLMVRPRGWHLIEEHATVDGAPMSGALFDFGLYLFHNAEELVARGTGPYLYLPKMEHYQEARLWTDVFRWSEAALDLDPPTIRATALIETLPAVFQMDEILWELRDHSAGLNCGRWDYLFSFIKQYQDRGDVVFADRDQLSMATPFLTAYSHLLVRTCHRRGAHAMGGMAAQIPIKDDPAANAAALAKVVADKEREVRAGHDGTWVAHPGLVPVAREVFDREMATPNQIDRPLGTESIGPAELLAIPAGTITALGIRRNARVAVRYLESWLRGIGCVPIDHLMEDAATAEIARTELWHWVRHSARQDDGTPVSAELVVGLLRDERARLLAERGSEVPAAAADRAVALLEEVVTSPVLEGFITRKAYPFLEGRG